VKPNGATISTRAAQLIQAGKTRDFPAENGVFLKRSRCRTPQFEKTPIQPLAKRPNGR
jgi:hypothetical protein